MYIYLYVYIFICIYNYIYNRLLSSTDSIGWFVEPPFIGSWTCQVLLLCLGPELSQLCFRGRQAQTSHHLRRLDIDGCVLSPQWGCSWGIFIWMGYEWDTIMRYECDINLRCTWCTLDSYFGGAPPIQIVIRDNLLKSHAPMPPI